MSAEVIVAPPQVATFADLKIGMKVRTGDITLTVFEKDALRVMLGLDANPPREVSFYQPEFDERGFEIVPLPAAPTKKPR